MVKLKPKNKRTEYEGKIDKMKLPLWPHGTIRAAHSPCTLSAIKDFTLLCVIKRVFLLVASQSKALQLEFIHVSVLIQEYHEYQPSDLFILGRTFQFSPACMQASELRE